MYQNVYPRPQVNELSTGKCAVLQSRCLGLHMVVRSVGMASLQCRKVAINPGSPSAPVIVMKCLVSPPLTVFENVKHSKARKVVEHHQIPGSPVGLSVFKNLSILKFYSYRVVPFRGHKVMIRGWSNMSLCILLCCSNSKSWQKLIEECRFIRRSCLFRSHNKCHICKCLFFAFRTQVPSYMSWVTL